MPPPGADPVVVERRDGFCVGRFVAMASSCEVLVDGDDEALTRRVAATAAAEAWRIEHKYSRYRSDNIVARLNGAGGEPVAIDEETGRLLDFAATLHTESGGLFDITSGVLRRAWKFDGSDRVPTPGQVEALLPLVGWAKVQRDAGTVRLPAGMELDFGGIGKEYAVDRALALVAPLAPRPMVVNFGGDLATNGATHPGRAWRIGVEDPDGGVARVLNIHRGAMATSGDARRFLLRGGVRYGHILNPLTGWPVRGAPRSVTVVAPTCVQAGALSTLAMLRGEGAEAFLAAQGVQHWILR